jgi:hypothetical protein
MIRIHLSQGSALFLGDQPGQCRARANRRPSFIGSTSLRELLRRATALAAASGLMQFTYFAYSSIALKQLQYCGRTEVDPTMLSSSLLRAATRTSFGHSLSARLPPVSRVAFFSSGSHDDFAPKRKSVEGEDEAIKLIKVEN